MGKKYFFLLIALVTIGGYWAKAQRPGFSLWTTVNLPVSFLKKWQWHNDGSYRTLGSSVMPVQYLYRTGLRYNFNKQLSAAGGMALFFTKTDFDKSHHEFGKEFRVWQELNKHLSVNKTTQLLLRLRTEQRFFAETSRKQKYTAHRFRIRPGLSQRLNDKWSLQLTDEYMRQVANKKFSFDQNRVTISGIYHVNKGAQVQAGYMWLKWPDANQHILTITFTKTISLHGD